MALSRSDRGPSTAALDTRATWPRSTSILADPPMSRTRTLPDTPDAARTIDSATSIRASLSAVTRLPHGMRDARHELAGRSWADRPARAASRRTSPFENPASARGLLTPPSPIARMPGR